MFSPELNKAEHLKFLEEMSEVNFARLRYCEEIAGNYIAVGKFENMLITAMHMCDCVKIKKILGDDADRWALSMAKIELLQGYTLGNLIKILEDNSVASEDIGYLRWIKNIRDYFIHRLFHDGSWPGDLDEEGCQFMIRRLLAIQLWLSRAERNIWRIFERANFVEMEKLADGGMLAMNLGIYDLDDE